MLRIDGKKLQAARENSKDKVTTEDLAKIAGLSRRRMQQLEHGGGNLNRNVGIAVAKYLGVNTRDICKDETEDGHVETAASA